MAGDPGQIMHNTASLSIRRRYSNPGLTSMNAQVYVETLTHVLEAKDEYPPSVPVHRQDPTLSQRKPITELLGNAKLRAMIRQIVRKEALRICASRVKEKVSKAVEEAFSDAFNIGFEPTGEDSKTTSAQFVTHIPMEMAHSGALEKMFDPSIER